ncbi:hypothetical protein HDU97_008049 [Phlyctochytrium planicorne]|nr:hypothetical protein HDU97_008049 [Phlyctochytrium planicorne]
MHIQSLQILLLAFTTALTTALPKSKIFFVDRASLNNPINFDDPKRAQECNTNFFEFPDFELVKPEDTVNKFGVLIKERVRHMPTGLKATGLTCTKPLVNVDPESAINVNTCNTLSPGKGITCVKETFTNNRTTTMHFTSTVSLLLALAATVASAMPQKKIFNPVKKEIIFVGQDALNNPHNFDDPKTAQECNRVSVGLSDNFRVKPADAVNKFGVLIKERITNIPTGQIATGLTCTKPLVDVDPEVAINVSTCNTLSPGKGITCVKESFLNTCTKDITSNDESGTILATLKCDNLKESCRCKISKVK